MWLSKTIHGLPIEWPSDLPTVTPIDNPTVLSDGARARLVRPLHRRHARPGAHCARLVPPLPAHVSIQYPFFMATVVCGDLGLTFYCHFVVTVVWGDQELTFFDHSIPFDGYSSLAWSRTEVIIVIMCKRELYWRSPTGAGLSMRGVTHNPRDRMQRFFFILPGPAITNYVF